jgi:hypothetical protein
MITFHLESWDQFYADGKDILQEHYAEFTPESNAPLQPDVSKYRLLDMHGRLLILTARSDGAIVGHQIVVLMPHPHHAQVLCGMVDAHFLSKEHRKGMTGVKLIKETLSVLQRLGVEVVMYSTKNKFQKIFERLGFTQTDVVMTRWLK